MKGTMKELDQALREQLVTALEGGNAHATFDEVVDKFPAHLRGQKAGLPYSAWQLVEHIRIAQEDILQFSDNREGKYKPKKWPEAYWPKESAPPSESAWERSIAAIQRDRDAMIALIRDARSDLAEPFSWGDGQNLIREAILIVDHNANHIGELLTLRRLLGIWPPH
jgi:hypothetical protein